MTVERGSGIVGYSEWGVGVVGGRGDRSGAGGSELMRRM